MAPDDPVAPDRAFLAFTLGPVQTFIAAARTVRDLWTGSFLLSWLTYEAMEPVRQCADARIISPGTAQKLTRKDLLSPDLPNRFVAEVPAARADELAIACRNACFQEWKAIANAVRKELSRQVHQKLGVAEEDWLRLWDAQVDSFFDLRTAVLPWAEADEATLDALLHSEKRRKDDPSDQRLWTDRFELTASLLAAAKLLRAPGEYDPQPDARGQYPAKCSLLGTYEQMGPADLGESARFWETFAEKVKVGGSRTRRRERLCAVSLVKRFAWPAHFAPETDSRPQRLNFDDTATVAAAQWLRKAASVVGYRFEEHSNWSGQWLHWPRPDFDPEEPCPQSVFEDIQHAKQDCGPVPTYYAVLMLDGDKMGDKFRSGAGADHHQRISSALSVFSRQRVRNIVVKDHEGTLIYAGGDDVLAVLPTATALACALALAQAFRENWEKHDLPQSNEATVSAGLAIVHYKEDLRFALNQARAAETRSKREGRNRLTVTVCRRSGEHSTAVAAWNFVKARLIPWVNAFLKAGVSDRWAYHLAADVAVLSGLNRAAIQAEIRRQVGRAEKVTKEQFKPDDVAHALAEYAPNEGSEGSTRSFITLCQTASFLARGRDA